MIRKPWTGLFAVLLTAVLVSCGSSGGEDIRTVAVKQVETAAAAAKDTAGAAAGTAAASAKATALAAGESVVSSARATAASAAETAAASAKATAVAAGESALAGARATALARGGTAVVDTAGQAQTRVAELRLTAEAALRGRTGAAVYTVDSDLTQMADVNGPALDAAFRTLRPDTPLIGLGQTFVDVGQQQGVNTFFVAALAAVDSNWGTSRLATEKNNLYGNEAASACPVDCSRSFKSRQESVQLVIPVIKADYLTRGGKNYNGATLRGMSAKYTTDPGWKDAVAAAMNALSASAR